MQHSSQRTIFVGENGRWISASSYLTAGNGNLTDVRRRFVPGSRQRLPAMPFIRSSGSCRVRSAADRDVIAGAWSHAGTARAFCYITIIHVQSATMVIRHAAEATVPGAISEISGLACKTRSFSEAYAG